MRSIVDEQRILFKQEYWGGEIGDDEWGVLVLQHNKYIHRKQTSDNHLRYTSINTNTLILNTSIYINNNIYIKNNDYLEV